MALRSTKVAQVPFINIGGGLSDIQEEKKRQALLAEFHSLCHHSRALTGSVLGTRIEPKATGVILEFFLHETPQAYLNFVGRTPVHPIGVANDMFANDVTLVTQEIHRCRELIRTAVNAAIPLDMLREKSPIGDQIRFIRRRLRKREIFYLPTSDEEPIAIPRFTQRFAGPAVTAKVKGKVTAHFERSVELTDAEVIGDIPDQLVGIELPTRMLMSRASVLKNLEQFLFFGNALDSGSKVELVVGVNLDSVNGRPTSLKFQSFHAE
jgi:hypothetical protein